MENSFQTSFIPKKPILTNSTVSTPSNTTSITMVVSFFIFIVMLVSAGGLYLYKNYILVKSKEDLSASLFKIRDSFDKNTIAELETYDKRTTVARDILSNHIVLSPLFETINKLTLSSIQYTNFEHTTNNSIFSVKMSGIAQDYKSIALQADVFNNEKEGKMFKDVIFSNLTKDKNNFVTFDLAFTVDPALLSYTNNLVNAAPSTDTTNVVNNIPTLPVDNTTPTTNTNQVVNTNTPLPASSGTQ